MISLEIEPGADAPAQLAGLFAGLYRLARRLEAEGKFSFGGSGDPPLAPVRAGALQPGPVFSKATRAPGCDDLG